MNLRDFQLGPRFCMEAFPFHLILDKRLSVQQVGDGLRKLIPMIELGKPFQDFFVEQDSRTKLSYDEIESRIGNTFQFQSHKNSAVRIRGGFYSIDDSYLLFLADPVIRDTGDIARLSLKFDDVARHNPFLYYIAALQAKEALLKDSRILVNGLEDLVSKRTKQLQNQAEELRLSESRLNEAQRMGKIGNWEWNVATREVWWSPEIYRIFGIDTENFTPSYDAFLEIVHPDDRGSILAARDRAVAGGEYAIQYRARLRDGTERTLNSKGEAVCDALGRVSRISGVTQDITDQVETEREVLAISERERSRIGHDLHDSLAQELTGLRLFLRNLQTRLADNARGHEEDFRQLHTVLDHAIESTRSLAQGLSPILRDSSLLSEGLKQLATHAKNTYRINCDVSVRKEIRIREETRALQLYRIAQEAITNAVRHGHAAQINVAAINDDGRLTLTISDDGVGIAPLKPSSSGMGLRIMEYRARRLGGVLTVNRRKEGGTLVTCTCPWERQHAESE